MTEIRVPAHTLAPGDTIIRGIQGARGRTVVEATRTRGRWGTVSITCDPPSRYFTDGRTVVTVDRPGARPQPKPTFLRAGRYTYRGREIIRHRRGWFDHDPMVRDHRDQRRTGWYIVGVNHRFPRLVDACLFLDEKP